MKSKVKKVNPKASVIRLSSLISFILIFMTIFNALCFTKFDHGLVKVFGNAPSSTQGNTHGADVEYAKSSFGSPAELYAYEEKKVAEIALEGITLLKNDGLLPLAKGTELSLFSHSSVDLVSGGSGSGSGSFDLTKNLKEGLENAGLKVNDKLWDFYSKGEGSKYKRGPGVINYGANLDWRINECPLDKIIDDSSLTQSFSGTVAMFVLSRTGGEGGDEARDMAAFDGESGKHYLEIDNTEREILKYLNDNFNDVILLVNCNNAVELGFVEEFPNIKAVVNFPGAGRTGTYGLGYMLCGVDGEGNAVSPSGHLVDTFVYDNFSSPAMQNMGDFAFENSKYYYVNYSEGIYVGYRYYETRYEDYVTERSGVGSYQYENTVLYPFGYGLSYTEFEWSNYKLSPVDENGKMIASVDVKNIGQHPGKDVVQIYVQAPYIEGGAEKASVNLVGFAKTKLLGVGESQTLTIEIDAKNFASYDITANGGKGGYVLDAGNYYITAASNAHEAINSILNKREADGDYVNLSKMVDSLPDSSVVVGESVHTYVQEKTDSTTYSSGIENRFGDAVLNDAKYLSRSNWSVMDNYGLRYGTHSDVKSRAEVGGKQFSAPLSSEMKKRLESFDSLNPNMGKYSTSVVFNAKNKVELIDLRGLPYDDPLWNQLLDRMDVGELSKLIDESGYCTPEMKSISKPKIIDLDGPAGLNDILGHASMPIGDGYRAMTWPTQYMLACTWNTQLAEDMGDGMAEDGLYSGTAGWYGPGMNIHRTPFAGRNFEYYSEDPFISGELGRAEVYGAAKKGMYAFIKHFAVNDQETHRDEYGLATFAQEQAIREIYLRPFEITLVDNDVEIFYNEPVYENNNIVSYTKKTATVPAASAVMTSFNRIGCTWSGGHYPLITGVLRGEWGFNGFVLTDYEVGPGKGAYMDTLQTIAAGGDAKLKAVGINAILMFNLKKHPEYLELAKEAGHHILYTVVNSAGMNGFVHGVRFVEGFKYYILVLGLLDVLAVVGVVLLSKRLRKRVKEYKAQKNS